MPGSAELIAVIRAQMAAAGGRLTFAAFMDLALFHPTLGYYSRPGAKIGRRGDFTTAPAFHPAFGEAVALQVAEMWERLGRPSPFPVVEVGAGGGHLARSLLTALPGPVRAAVQYAIVERSPALRAVQQGALAGLPVIWREALPPGGLTGVVLSNELFDALPVHRLVQAEAGLQELYVTWDGQGLAEVADTPSSPVLAEVLAAGGVRLRPGHRAEVSLAAGEMIRAMGRSLERGYVLTIDYGDEASRLYGPRRPAGTLRCYFRHLEMDSPYERVGLQDITADVNFTHLAAAGRDAGLAPLGLVTQGAFLQALGLGARAEALAARARQDRSALADLEQIRFLLDPYGVGGAFRVLIQGKGAGGPLRGLPA